MTKVLIVAEHDGSVLNPATGKCVTCAAALGGAEIDILVLASSAADIAAEASAIAGVFRRPVGPSDGSITMARSTTRAKRRI